MTQPGGTRRVAGRLLAELVVIVLGVWIALWAEGWATERQDRSKEIVRLRALSENVSQSLEAIRSEQDDADGAADALRELITLSEVTSDPSGIRSAFMYGLLFVPSFTPEMNVYEDLKNSGELALLTNQSLRQALSAMEASVVEVGSAQQDMETVQQLNFDPYLLARLDLRPILGPNLDLPDLGPTPQFSFDFILTVEFRNLALFKLDLLAQIDSAMDVAGERLTLVAQLIEEQLRASSES